jgi:flagellin
MSSIVLSASVRQNLLSLQSTAELLSTTQTRLATGKKVNTALDNPTNFFTAAGLDARASDINNLLDGIGNGVQVLQAANTGITSLQKLVDTAKSIANQALQTTGRLFQRSPSVTTGRRLPARAALTICVGTASAGTAATAGVRERGFASTTGRRLGRGFGWLARDCGDDLHRLGLRGARRFFGLGELHAESLTAPRQAVTIDAAAVTAFTGGGGTLVGLGLRH